MRAAPAESRDEAIGVRHWLAHNAWRIVLLFVGLLLPLAGFVELAEEIHEAETLYLEQSLMWQWRAHAAPGLDAFFALMSKLGYEWGVIPLDVLVVAVLLWQRRWRNGLFAATAFAGSALLNLGSKQVFQRERPGLWESIAPESTYSFPSGHAMGSMTLAVTLVFLAWPTRWRWPVLLAMALFVPLVGLSRVHLGVHYPSDILAGWCAALVWVVGVRMLMFHKRWVPPPRVQASGSENS